MLETQKCSYCKKMKNIGEFNKKKTCIMCRQKMKQYQQEQIKQYNK